MKQAIRNTITALALLFLSANTLSAQTNNANNQKETTMKTFVIEREIKDAGKFTPADLKGIAQKSCGVVKQIGTGIEWVNSYVTGNKLYCIYKAENEELIRQHAKLGGFPANKISEVTATFSPATAE